MFFTLFLTFLEHRSLAFEMIETNKQSDLQKYKT